MPLSKRIIPCLDVDNGRVVKGIKFRGVKDAGDPVELAKNTATKELMNLSSLTLQLKTGP